jgi:uncharacterized membrane protein YgcG
MDPHPISHLSQVISQAVAPAFILGALAGFIGVLVTRLNRIIDRCRILAEGDQSQRERRPDDINFASLNARANLINIALFWAVASALVTLLLIIIAFADALFELPHERAAALLFIVALLLFGASLVNFGREIRIAIRDPNNFD